SRCAEQASLGISLGKARRPVCYGEITGDLARDAHQKLAEILPAQKADESPWSVLESYAKRLANGICDLCEQPAPFQAEGPVRQSLRAALGLSFPISFPLSHSLKEKAGRSGRI